MVRYILFPAYAGVILKPSVEISRISAFPRIRGVIPTKGALSLHTESFPRIRGGDPKTNYHAPAGAALFPAYAGVIPTPSCHFWIVKLFPAYAGVIP